MVTEGDIIVTFGVAIFALYMALLGLGMILGQQRGVAYVNRIARKIVAWPVEMLGKLLLGLAKAIRG